MCRILVQLAVALAALVFSTRAAAAENPSPLRLASFRCDATPPLGEPMIWDVPLKTVLDPLLAKGVVLEQGDDRYILCTIDWCELCNNSELTLRRKLAEAARTTPDRVAIATVHQHAAPYADAGAHTYLDLAPPPPVLHLSDAYLNRFGEQLASAVRDALTKLSEFDRLGAGQARVDRVASARRLHGPDGKIITRYSTGAANPALAAAEEGTIDPFLKTITLARGDKPLVRLHFYATHPQTFACDGRCSSDFVGLAREELEKQEQVFQIYFTGCSGDITVGKYNDGKDASREPLKQRLLAGMQASIAATKWEKIDRIGWRKADLELPARDEPNLSRDALLARINDPKAASGVRIYSSAIRLAYLDRMRRPLLVRCLELGSARIVQLPGEPMLEFQRYSQSIRADRFVAVGGYFDCGPGYICTDEAFSEGGYEPSASNAAKGSEACLKRAIRDVLAIPD